MKEYDNGTKFKRKEEDDEHKRRVCTTLTANTSMDMNVHCANYIDL